MLAQRGRFDVPRPDEVKPKMAATLYVGNDLPARFMPAAG